MSSDSEDDEKLCMWCKELRHEGVCISSPLYAGPPMTDKLSQATAILRELVDGEPILSVIAQARAFLSTAQPDSANRVDDATLRNTLHADERGEVSLGKVMMAVARGEIPSGPLPPEMAAGLQRNLDRITREGIAKARAEQEAILVARIQNCRWPLIGSFSVRDEPGEHDPCYLVCPDGSMVELKHHATNGVDQARAQWIADACNAALSAPAAQPPHAEEAGIDLSALVTNEVVRAATSIFFMQMAGDCLKSNDSIEAWHGCMRATLRAAAPLLLAELRRVRERE